MNHLGCPVMYGDKWILNKWIRWEAQMDNFKCFLPRGENFPSNKQKYCENFNYIIEDHQTFEIADFEIVFFFLH